MFIKIEECRSLINLDLVASISVYSRSERYKITFCFSAMSQNDQMEVEVTFDSAERLDEVLQEISYEKI